MEIKLAAPWGVCNATMMSTMSNEGIFVMRAKIAAVGVFSVLGFLTLANASVGQAQTTLFFDDFSGSGSPLNGSTPDITVAGEVWEAGNTWFDNGVAESPVAGGPDGQAAHLNFTPVGGAIYTAEATITNPNTNWMAFGFLPDVPAGAADWTVQSFAVRHSNAPGYAWALTRNNPNANDQEGFLGGGTAGGQPWNGDVLNSAQPIDFKIILNTTGLNWTAEWFFNGVSQGAPVAYGVEGNPGIGGIGFSHERNASANSGATITSFSLTEELEPTALSLIVNTTTGVISIRNVSAEPFAFDYYSIESAGNELNSAGWNSLESQGADAGLPANFNSTGGVDGADLAQWEGDFGVNADSDADFDLDSDGNDFLLWQKQLGQSPGPQHNWQEAGGISDSQLAELFLDGATTLAPGEEVSLGMAYDGGTNGDLVFQFSAPGSTLIRGVVEYGTGSLSSLSVPEPSSVLLLLTCCSVLPLCGRRRG